MSNDIVKKLTGKNPQDFEFAASHIINNADIEAFSALVEKSEFLFDFIKKNVEKRLLSAVNTNNYKNLMQFLKIYSPNYEDVIISSLVKYADEDLTDEMLDLLENGTDEEKTYSAKYFAQINDSLALDLLRGYANSEVSALAFNSAVALSAMKDNESYQSALEKLKSDDEFEKLSAVTFLVAYNDKNAVADILKTMKTSSMPENIASEIPYLQSVLELLETRKDDAILTINHLITGLGEIVSLSQIFDFQLFELIEKLIKIQNEESFSNIALVLVNARQKFEQLTENDEYMFDEEKNIKNEILEIKKLLNSQSKDFWNVQEILFQEELDEKSDFLFSALELVQDLCLTESLDELKNLLASENQTIILKTIEVIKSLNKISEINLDEMLNKISDENIKVIITSLFRG